MMDVIGPILLTAFVIFAAVMALRQNKQNRAKSNEQRREELWKYSQSRVNEEFKQTKELENDSSEEE
ncbi:MAG: hypothetical protein IJ111_10020 [Eggerthellaceae bacterium]|nr:hypothetical protein [Eggerthellaceae bacterium]